MGLENIIDQLNDIDFEIDPSFHKGFENLNYRLEMEHLKTSLDLLDQYEGDEKYQILESLLPAYSPLEDPTRLVISKLTETDEGTEILKKVAYDDPVGKKYSDVTFGETRLERGNKRCTEDLKENISEYLESNDMVDDPVCDMIRVTGQRKTYGGVDDDRTADILIDMRSEITQEWNDMLLSGEARASDLYEYCAEMVLTGNHTGYEDEKMISSIVSYAMRNQVSAFYSALDGVAAEKRIDPDNNPQYQRLMKDKKYGLQDDF